MEYFTLEKKDRTTIKITFKNENKEEKEFYISLSAIFHILSKPTFRPYYVDFNNFIQFTERKISFFTIIKTNTNEKPMIEEENIPFREEELLQCLSEIINSIIGTKIDITNIYEKSIKMLEPNVNEYISDKAANRCNDKEIIPFLEKVRNFAKNYSKGQDDEIKLVFMAEDGPKDLYWTICRENNLLMNGGIIYDKRENSWRIHT